jgi:catechol 2,3-dioxygenase-like lactoylglutathione lyase family enzyme
MAKVILGNHTAVFAARSEQDRIRRFYCEVLGCKPRVKTDAVDRFQLDDVHFCFVYQDTALDECDFLKAIYLELKTDNRGGDETEDSRLRRRKTRCAGSTPLFPSTRRAGV